MLIEDVGFMLQTAFVTMTLVGLFGSAIFPLAMSPDGSTFNDAVRADTDTGLVTLPGNPKFGAFYPGPRNEDTGGRAPTKMQCTHSISECQI